MRRSIFLSLLLLLNAGIFTACSQPSLEAENAQILRECFSGPQWRSMEFSAPSDAMGISPLGEESDRETTRREKIREASRLAGATPPILPGEQPEAKLPAAPRLAQWTKRSYLPGSDSHGYAMTFFAYVKAEDFSDVYSAWVSVVPQVEEPEGTGLVGNPKGDQFVYSVEDSPEEILGDMEAYFQGT